MTPLPAMSREQLLQELQRGKIKESLARLGLNPRTLQALRNKLAIPREESYPMQRAILAVLHGASSGKTMPEIQQTLQAQSPYAIHRQSIWAACQVLVRRGKIVREGYGRNTLYQISTV